MKNIFIIILALVFLTGCATVEVSRENIEVLDETPAQAEQEEETPAPPPEPPPQPEETTPVEEEPEDEAPEEEPTSSIVEVMIGSGKFDPAEVTIKVGETVTWTNLYEASIMISGPKGTFSTKLGGGESYSYTFEETGKYAIIKVVDPIFFGKVFVED